MDRSLNRGTLFRLLQCSALALLTAALAWSAVASAQTSTPTAASTTASAPKPISDALVEANVLKALAAAPDLLNQPITTTTVYGVVTLTGTVQTEQLRSEAETIVSTTRGVKKVVDEMTLSDETINSSPEQDSGATATEAQDANDGQGTNPNLQSDGTMAPVQPAQAQSPMPQSQPDNTGVAQTQSGGQEAGMIVTVPVGATMRIRVNQSLSSARSQPGDRFDGIVMNDVVADGAVAVPRGTAVEGTVVDAKDSGVLSGHGALSLRLTQVTLGGQNYPIVSDVWGRRGSDKTTHTVNDTVIGGGIGALLGAAAGGGAGAAVGAGIGGLLGLGSSAASGNGQVFVPSEGLLTFHLAQPTTVATVSQQEMDRLAQAVPSVQPQPLRRRYPVVYYGPGYYRPYPYPYGYPYPYPY